MPRQVAVEKAATSRRTPQFVIRDVAVNAAFVTVNGVSTPDDQGFIAVNEGSTSDDRAFIAVNGGSTPDEQGFVAVNRLSTLDD